MLFRKKPMEMPGRYSDMLDKIDPGENKSHYLNKVKGTKDGGLIICCRHWEQNNKFLSLVSEKRSDSCVVKEITGAILELVKGVPENHDVQKINQLLVDCNLNIFTRPLL